MTKLLVIVLGLSAVQTGPTAEELLKELRRKRPLNPVILPSGVSASGQGARQALFPEGAISVDRNGTLARDGAWWTFVFDPADDQQPVKLLPNATLDVMVKTAQGAPSQVTFSVSGEMSVFEDENYMLVRLARRAVQPPIPVEGTTPAESAGGDSTEGAEDAPGSDAPVSANASVDDIVAAMQQQVPDRPALPALPREPVVPPDRQRTSASLALLPDGAAVVRRPGRIVHEGDDWIFVFESDHPDHPEPPLTLLLNKSLELMVEASERGSNGLVFLVTGEVTLFDNENFLLPHVAIRRIDDGNLKK